MDRLNKYPESDSLQRFVSLDNKGKVKISFTVEDSGLVYYQYPLFSLILAALYPEWSAIYALIGRYRWHFSREVVYTDELTGKTYPVLATAWEIHGGLRIQKALYIANQYQYEGPKSLLKDARDNALFNMVASTEKAVANMLAHAEIVVKAMALHDRSVIEMGGDSEYNAWLDGLKN